MKMSGMKVLATVLLLVAIGFTVWGISGHTDAYAPAAIDFVASVALFAQIRKIQSGAKDGEGK